MAPHGDQEAQAQVQLRDFKNIYSLEGKIAVVTGGSRGLGLHAASGQVSTSFRNDLTDSWQTPTSRMLQGLYHVEKGSRVRRSLPSSECAPGKGRERPSHLHSSRPEQVRRSAASGGRGVEDDGLRRPPVRQRRGDVGRVV